MTQGQHYPALFGMEKWSEVALLWKAAEFLWNHCISPGRAALGGTGGIHTRFHLPFHFQKEYTGTASENAVENNSSISLSSLLSKHF